MRNHSNFHIKQVVDRCDQPIMNVLANYAKRVPHLYQFMRYPEEVFREVCHPSRDRRPREARIARFIQCMDQELGVSIEYIPHLHSKSKTTK